MSSKEIGFLFKHSTIYGIGTVLSQAVGFIMLPIYTRYLTPKDYGVLQLIEISTFMLGLVITTGIAQTLTRFYYESEEIEERNKIVSTMYFTYCFIAFCFIPLLFFASPILSNYILDSPAFTEYFYVSFISFILGGLLDIGLTYLRVINKSGYFTIISLGRLIMLLSLNIYFIVFKGLGVLGILYSVLVTRIFFQFILTIPILLKLNLRFSFRCSVEMLKFSLPLIPARLASTFVNQSDRYFIRYFVSIADTGIYSLAQKIGTAIHLLITCSFQSAFDPRRYKIVKRSNAKQTFNKIFIYHATVLIFIGLAISVFIPEILRVMVTSEFYRAGKFVPLIIFSMILFGFRNHFEFGILWSKNTKYYAYINGLMAFINLGLNYLFISMLGLWGAIYSATLCIIIHNGLIYWFGKKHYYIRFDFQRVTKLFAIAFIIYGISLLIKTNYIIVDVLIKCFFMLLFPIILIWIRIITPDEIKMIKEIYSLRIKPIAVRLFSIKFTK